MYKLIKIQNKFTLVSDEEIKEGNVLPYVMRWENGYEIFNSNNGIRKSKLSRAYKIIAGIPSLPITDFSLLSEEDCKKIGWLDVEKLADKYAWNCKNEFFTTKVKANECVLTSKRDFIEGFNIAQFLNDKMFSLDDMENAVLAGMNCNKDNKELLREMLPKKETAKILIQSLQQTSWDVEVEMEIDRNTYLGKEQIGITPSGEPTYISSHAYKPKITNNSIRVIKIL